MMRAWIAAGFATIIAASSHTLGGGSIPNPLILMFSLAISGLICLTLAGKVLSLPRLSLAVLLSQAIFHTLFSITPAVSSVSGTSVGTHHAGMQQMPVSATMPEMVDMDHNSLPMLGAHLIAATITIALLRRGEVAAIALWRAISLELLDFFSIRFVHPPAAPETISAVVSSHFRALTDLGAPRLTMRHRGPPEFPAPA